MGGRDGCWRFRSSTGAASRSSQHPCGLAERVSLVSASRIRPLTVPAGTPESVGDQCVPVAAKYASSITCR
jgi:hypothetical protein